MLCVCFMCRCVCNDRLCRGVCNDRLCRGVCDQLCVCVLVTCSTSANTRVWCLSTVT